MRRIDRNYKLKLFFFRFLVLLLLQRDSAFLSCKRYIMMKTFRYFHVSTRKKKALSCLITGLGFEWI